MQSVIDLLASPAVAIDEKHLPKLYSRFLAKLLAKPMAKHDHSSSNSGMNQPQTSRSRTNANGNRSEGGSQPSSASYNTENFDIPSTVFNHPSPTTSNSLSPAPTSAALSFDHFAPLGGVDPFAPPGLSSAIHSVDGGLGFGGGLFEPPLAYDAEIMQHYQSLADPTGWSDIAYPRKSFVVMHSYTTYSLSIEAQFQDLGTNWMNQFQQTTNGMYNNPDYTMRH